MKVNDTKNDITLKKIRITQTSLNLDLTSTKNNPIGYVEVKDNNGNMLSSGIGVSNGDSYEGISYLNSIGDIPKHITIAVYGVDENNKLPMADFKVNL